MKPLSTRLQIWIVTAFVTTLAPGFARGDGGIIQLREVKGPYSVTVFTSPEADRAGLIDVSVLIQWQKTGEVVLDADVSLTLQPPNHGTIKQSDPLCSLPSASAAFGLPDMQHPLSVRATREQASNKLLYAAPVELDAAGDWKLNVFVSREADTASFDCLLPVTLASGGLKGLWPYLALPPIAITAFAMNQRLRWRSLEKTTMKLSPSRRSWHPERMESFSPGLRGTSYPESSNHTPHQP